LPKTHQDYWRPRLRKRLFAGRDGKTNEIPTWQIRLKHENREAWFNLDSANQEVAAIKARDIFVFLLANRWEATLAKFKPKGPELGGGVTVGEFLDQTRAVSGLTPTTFAIYARKFRTLVSGVFGVKGGASKHDYVNGGYQRWLTKVHGVKLDKLTPQRINDWKVKTLKSASKNPLLLKRANVTVRSVMLSSKALFSPKVTKHLALKLPNPLPLAGVSLPEIGKSRYKSEVDPAVLLIAARRELAEGDQGEGKPREPSPEIFKVILLALGAGLRRDEIDTLQWRQILWGQNAIRIETTEFGGTKSHDSENDIDVDPGLLEILKSYLPKPGEGTPFVIQSPVSPRPAATSYHHYRCDRVFKEAVEWLRGKGITARNALHSLRKEFGSQICKQAGIYAASVALRHSSITITRDYYLEKKQPAFLSITKLMQKQPSEEPSGAMTADTTA
jgi:integrase